MDSSQSHVSLWLDRPPTNVRDPFQPGAHFDAVIVGAGLTGLTTALMLARGGMRVAVLEARFIGAVTTGNTTAKLSLLHGTVLSGIRHHFSAKVVRAYVDGNRAGQSWMLKFLSENNVPVQHRDAFTYADTPEGTATIDAELEVSRDAGLDVKRANDIGLPYPTFGAVRLANQAQFNPMEVLDALTLELRSLGGVVVEGVRVTDVDTGDPSVVATTSGEVTADHVVLATGTPILDRGFYFAKVIPERSYAAAFRVPGAPDSVPAGMYLSAGSPTRSLRTAPVNGEELLLVGGNGHPVGRGSSTTKEVEDLDAWTGEHFPGAERTHRWSAQDYQSANMVPFVGWLPRGGGKIFLATGYNKWGMTNAVAAALSLAKDLLDSDEDLPWAKVLHHRITGAADIVEGAKFNAGVAAHLAKGWMAAEFSGPDLGPGSKDPAEGEGVVGHHGGRPVAVSKVDGVTCKVSGVCTHFGGVLNWNDAERSWDCPLHGSRFSANGALLEGPATKDLETIDPDEAPSPDGD